MLAAAYFSAHGNSRVTSDDTDAVLEVLRDGDADRPADGFARLGLTGFDVVAVVRGCAVDLVAAGDPAVVASLSSGAVVVGPGEMLDYLGFGVAQDFLPAVPSLAFGI